MFARRNTSTETTTETVKGPSLARGPAWAVGLVLSVFGLMMFFKAPGGPLSTTEFPDGVATGVSWLGFEMNAWTAWLTTAAGILVLIGAAQHLAARTFSLIAGLGLGAMAVIALIDGDDVFGLAAANGLDALGWGIAAGVLLVTALLPRLQREREVAAVAPVSEQDRIADRDLRAERHRPVVAEPSDEQRVPNDRIADQPIADARNADERVAEHERHRIADLEAERAAPGGVRSEALRRTYTGDADRDAAQAEAEREAGQTEAEFGAVPTDERTRTR